MEYYTSKYRVLSLGHVEENRKMMQSRTGKDVPLEDCMVNIYNGNAVSNDCMSLTSLTRLIDNAIIEEKIYKGTFIKRKNDNCFAFEVVQKNQSGKNVRNLIKIYISDNTMEERYTRDEIEDFLVRMKANVVSTSNIKFAKRVKMAFASVCALATLAGASYCVFDGIKRDAEERDAMNEQYKKDYYYSQLHDKMNNGMSYDDAKEAVEAAMTDILSSSKSK